MTRLSVNSLKKEYPTRGEPLVVLKNVDLSLESGDNLAILGPSGTGKSTLLHIVGTLEPPTEGQTTLDDVDPFDLVQLANVIRTCRTSSSLSAAGRTLFAASRSKRKTVNDADRLRKYLQKFDLSWEAI